MFLFKLSSVSGVKDIPDQWNTHVSINNLWWILYIICNFIWERGAGSAEVQVLYGHTFTDSWQFFYMAKELSSGWSWFIIYIYSLTQINNSILTQHLALLWVYCVPQLSCSGVTPLSKHMQLSLKWCVSSAIHCSHAPSGSWMHEPTLHRTLLTSQPSCSLLGSHDNSSAPLDHIHITWTTGTLPGTFLEAHEVNLHSLTTLIIFIFGSWAIVPAPQILLLSR